MYNCYTKIVYRTYNLYTHALSMDEDQKWNVILKHQTPESNYLKEKYPKLIDTILMYRTDIIEVIAIDILLKKIRRIACKNTSKKCSTCEKDSCVSFEDIDRVIWESSEELLRSIKEYEYNSFSIPRRWMIFQDIIDKYFPDDIWIVYFEVWCSSWNLGKVLTNSNYAKSYFQHNEQQRDNRETIYYGIDPHLTLDIDDMLANIAWSWSETHKYKEDIKKFTNDDRFLNNNIALDKKKLEIREIEPIKNKLMDMTNSLKSSTKNLIVITSMVRYHHKHTITDNRFLKMLKDLMIYIHENTGVETHYISRELYDKNWLLYPSKWEDPYQSKVFIHTLQENHDIKVEELKDFTYLF